MGQGFNRMQEGAGAESTQEYGLTLRGANSSEPLSVPTAARCRFEVWNSVRAARATVDVGRLYDGPSNSPVTVIRAQISTQFSQEFAQSACYYGGEW